MKLIFFRNIAVYNLDPNAGGIRTNESTNERTNKQEAFKLFSLFVLFTDEAVFTGIFFIILVFLIFAAFLANRFLAKPYKQVHREIKVSQRFITSLLESTLDKHPDS